MTCLGSILVYRTASAVEVSDFTLLMCGNQLGSEWQTDCLPTLCQVDIAVWCTLIPHVIAVIKVISDRTVEVTLVYQQMVGSRFARALYQVSIDRCYRCSGYFTILIVRIIIVVFWIDEVSCQHIERLLIVSCRRSIYQQVRCLAIVDDIQQAIVVEQRQIESPGIDITLRVFRIVMTGKVDGGHIRICRLQVLVVIRLRLRVGHQVHNGVEVCHTHRLRLIVGRCTIDAVALVGNRQTTTVLHDS